MIFEKLSDIFNVKLFLTAVAELRILQKLGLQHYNVIDPLCKFFSGTDRWTNKLFLAF